MFTARTTGFLLFEHMGNLKVIFRYALFNICYKYNNVCRFNGYFCLNYNLFKYNVLCFPVPYRLYL